MTRRRVEIQRERKVSRTDLAMLTEKRVMQFVMGFRHFRLGFGLFKDDCGVGLMSDPALKVKAKGLDRVRNNVGTSPC